MIKEGEYTEPVVVPTRQMHPALDNPLPEGFKFALHRMKHSKFKITYLGQPLDVVMMYQDMLQLEKEGKL